MKIVRSSLGVSAISSLTQGLSVLVLALLTLTSACAKTDPLPGGSTMRSPANLGNKDRLEWFREARFGMFIHWGLYALPAGEWNGRTNHGEWIQFQESIPGAEYEKLAGQFNPVEFDAKEWVSVAKQAGMKYMVITTKHHEGFVMYDSQLTDYDIVEATPFGRDPMKELAESAADRASPCASTIRYRTGIIRTIRHSTPGGTSGIPRASTVSPIPMPTS